VLNSHVIDMETLKGMTEHHYKANPWLEGIITAVAVGGFLIILGVVFGLTPGIPQKTVDFFGDFTGQSYPLGGGAIILPAPAHPAAHMDFYTAVFNFMIGIGVLQVVILGLRLYAHSRIHRIAETVGNMIFWFFGAAAAYIFLMSGTLAGWFQFWAAIIIIAGISLVVRGIIHFATWRRHGNWR
jgi:hypothetical protein